MDSYDLIIVNDFAHYNGGTAMVALNSARALAEAGQTVTLFTAVAPVADDLNHKNIKVICTDQFEIAKDPNRLRAIRQGLWNKEAALKMSLCLDDFDPAKTIVHVHGWTKSLSSSVVQEAIQRKFHVIISLHDYFVACPNGGFYNYKKKHICKLKPLSKACVLSNCDKANYLQKLYRLNRQYIQNHIGRIPADVKHYISISDFSRDILAEYLPDEANIYDVTNPVFVDKQAPIEFNKRTNKFILIGRLTPEKGLFLLAESLRKANCEAIFVGDGECRKELEEKYPEIKITGWVSHDKVNEYIRSARALVLPSLWYETQGLVVAEAAANGIPAIVPDCSAAREMVIDKKTGLWFKGGDLDSLTEAIIKLNNSETASAMGHNAFDNFWFDPPTIQKHINRLNEVYQSILTREALAEVEKSVVISENIIN